MACKHWQEGPTDAPPAAFSSDGLRADISGRQSSSRGKPPPPNRRLLIQAEPLHATPKCCASLARAVSRRPPHRYPPCVFCSPALFSACSHHTGSPAYVWCVCRPLSLFSAIAHSISSLIGLLSKGFHLVGFTFVTAGVLSRRLVWFNILGVALAAWATHTRSGGLPPGT
jgi:hypothetical protein